MIRINCPVCNLALEFDSTMAGKSISCPDCSKTILISPNFDSAIAERQLLLDAPLIKSENDAGPLDFLDQADGAPFLSAFRRGTEEPEAPSLLDFPCEQLPVSCRPLTTDLGEPLASFNFGHGRYLNRCLIGGGCIFVGLVLLLIDVSRFQGRFLSAWALLFACAVFFAFGMIWIISAILAVRRSPAGTLWICPRGLIWNRRPNSGGCSWHEIRDLYVRKTRTDVKKPGLWESDEIDSSVLFGWKQLTPRYSGLAHWNYQYVVECPHTKPFVFSSETAPEEVKAFGDRIQFETTRALLPLYRKRLCRGETLAFSPFHISPQGVFHGNNSILWSEVSAITTGLDRVTIHRKDDKPWQIIPFGDISHALVFIALVDEMLESLRTPADRRAENSLDF